MPLFRRKKTPAPVVQVRPFTPPNGASYMSDITLKEALTTPGLLAKLQALGTWWPNSRLGRGLARYGNRDGDLLAGGMALTILISLTAALTVALTLFMAVLGNYPSLQEGVFAAINEALPGILKTGDGKGIIDPQDLVRTDIVNIPNAVGLLIAAWTGLGVVGKLGRSIRTMFGVVILPEAYIKTLLRSLLGAMALLVSVVVGSGIGLVVDLYGERLFALANLENSMVAQKALTALSYAIPFLIHMLVSWVLIRVVAGIRAPKYDLVVGLLVMSSVAILLRVLGAGLVASAKGPLLTTAATLVTLILWINLQMRMTLMVAAWMANPPRAVPVTAPEQMRFYETPNYVTMSDPATLAWPRHDFTGELEPAPEAPELPQDYQPYFGPEPRRTFKSWLLGPREKGRTP